MTSIPTADEVAFVFRAACQKLGEDYVQAVTTKVHFKARTYAFLALAHKYPAMFHHEVMTLLGVDEEKAKDIARAAKDRARQEREESWYKLHKLNEILASMGWPRMSAEEASLRRHREHAKAKPVQKEAPKPAPAVAPPVSLPPRISLAPVRLDSRVSDAPPTAAEIAAIESMYAA